MTVAEAEAARRPQPPVVVPLVEPVDETSRPSSDRTGPAGPQQPSGGENAELASGRGEPAAQALNHAAAPTAPVIPSFLPVAQDVLPGAPPPRSVPKLAPSPVAPPVSASPAPQDSLELLHWFDAHPGVAAGTDAPSIQAVDLPPTLAVVPSDDHVIPGSALPGPDRAPLTAAPLIPVQPVPVSATRMVVPPLLPVVSAATGATVAPTPPEVTPADEPLTAPPPQCVPGPRVELGFRDGSHAQLDPAGEQAQALEELARTLTEF